MQHRIQKLPMLFQVTQLQRLRSVFESLYIIVFLCLLLGCGSDNQGLRPVDVGLTIDQLQNVTANDFITISGTVERGTKVFVAAYKEIPESDAVVVDTHWSYKVTGLTEGENNITIIAKDMAGNTAKTNTVIWRDTKPPSLSINVVPSISNRKSLSISGTVEAGASLQIVVDSKSTTINLPSVTGVAWQSTLDGLTAGINNITVTAKDAAGNTAQAFTQVRIEPVELIAHRGSSFAAPENTLAAFNLAWEQGADQVELDIHLSKDNRIMVIHDPTTERTAGTEYSVRNTDSSVLRTLDVGKFKGSQYTGEKIPYLEEAIATIPIGKRLLVDIKTGVEILPFLKDIIEKSGKTDLIQVQSFNLTVASQFKKMMPSIPVYYLVGSVADVNLLIQTVLNNGINGIAFHYSIVNQTFIELASAANLKSNVWTVNDSAIAKALLEYGVNGIITDDPLLIRDVLNNL